MDEETRLSDIIGDHAEGDFRLTPSDHARKYREAAPELADVLERADVQTKANEYERANSDAVEAQNAYKRWMARANLAVLATAVSSACVMAGEILSSPDVRAGIPANVTTLLSVLSALAAAFAGFCLYRLRARDLLGLWMSRRARAEMYRLGYFSTIAARATDEGGARTVALALEYFRRYQLDLQMNYYGGRARQHLRSADRTVLVGGLGVGIASLSSLGGLGGGAWTAFGALSVAGAALGAFATGRELMTQDRRNAERYERTRDALVAFRARLEPVRTAAAKGNGKAVMEFVRAVNEQVSLEHRQWLEGREGAETAMAELEKALASSARSE